MAESHILQNAQGLVMNNPQLMNNPQIIHIHEAEKQGLKILLAASIPAAAYDSSEHPRHCHPGTRYQYIDRIVNWGLNDTDRSHRILWLKGPAGVGKSAIAQSCAEEFAAQKKLAAAFFFSRPNQRDDPQRLFTSISYQWASRYKPYAEILKSTIDDDPTIVDKEFPHQFHHLFASPLRELVAKGEDILERVVIVDGLDECAGETAQQAIVEIITASIRDDTTPFVWIFCSRLEPHLVATFNSHEVSATTRQEELAVSRTIDNEIAKYLTDELAKIGVEHGLPLPWPRERDIGTLVNLSGGLFIYASTVVRFIGDRNSLGPQDQLQAVLALARTIAEDHSEHPLSELDFFYLLILQRVPAKILRTIQWILLATTISAIGNSVERNQQLLGLSSSQFLATCRTLHSVMKVEESKIVFYHASFMDFMQDPRRSKQFCVRSESGLALQANLMRRLRAVCNDPDVEPYSASFRALVRADSNSLDVYRYIVLTVFSLYSYLPRDNAILTALASFNFKRMAEFWPYNAAVHLQMDKFSQHIPRDRRSGIIRSCTNSDQGIYAWDASQKPSWAAWDGSYVLGCDQRKCFFWRHPENGYYYLRPYHEPPPIEQMTIEHPVSETPIAEPPATKKTQRTFMQRLKFWGTRTLRRPVQQSHLLEVFDHRT
ncbi:hypothetical protein P691DRAFT_778219 [Macrolepiota fuliginosa MF-IS2]|uniref:Nephrocystin 3-like N-terminal domain-containing protein n=1 Tax=Macrolepiota fuliginosa MF-IS2 TaxID=1400762 RepID=A0A9P6BYP2_9AGAR|nr:hypothetical protein P691DRAFT_778219 [Macrolepiota fuliginosa MF-IS2]